MSDRYCNAQGEVAYVVSPGYGSGWYSQNGHKYPDCATDPMLITLILAFDKWLEENENRFTYMEMYYGTHEDIKRKKKEIEAYAYKQWPDGYWSADKLEVEYAPRGNVVEYSVFDGAESVFAYKPDTSNILVL